MAKLIIANWKMNGDIAKVKQDLDFYAHNHDQDNVILALPSLFLGYAKTQFPNSNFKLSSQDVSIQNGFGAFTGEVSADMLSALGVDYAIIGHSERRHIFADSDDVLLKKLNNSLSANMNVIFCVGELLESRRSGDYIEVVKSQLSLLKGVDKNIIIAYEPCWAIGSGLVPSSQDIEEMMNFIHSYMSEHGNDTSVLYGGSVNAKNIAEILATNGVDGVLVGGASLKPAEFSVMCEEGLKE